MYNGNAALKLDEWWEEYWQPPALLNPWQWAEKNLVFSARYTAYPGKYSSALTPYVRDILEDFQDPTVRNIYLCFSAQSSKTTTLSVALAYVIDQAPGPALFVMPSEKAACSFSDNRLQPLIEDCETLSRHKTGNRHDFKKGEYILDRMSVFLQGANSPNQLSSRPIKYLYGDEIDKWLGKSSKEADSWSLAVERVKTYRDHKVVGSSTPTIPSGKIWQLYLSGDQRRYFVPCPHCGVMFVLEWDQLKFPEDKDAEMIRKETYLECPHCETPIYDKHKPTMLINGEWQATNNKAPEDTRSYQLPELYSPWTRWGEFGGQIC